DDAERVAAAKALECDDAEADDGVVDRAHDDERVVTTEDGCVGGLERWGDRLSGRPEGAALHRGELAAGGVGQLFDPREVLGGGGGSSAPHATAQLVSCSILYRIVRRARCASS